MLLLFRSGEDNNAITTPVSQILTQSTPTGSLMFINFAPLRGDEQLVNAGVWTKEEHAGSIISG